ncbi:MAG TPA: Hsp20/alpha crystallin family protein [Gammaproteobacteria bacterium]|nr:Hsp20/alpha crystallin family protein [Gammaproteobacteria bacterium]
MALVRYEPWNLLARLHEDINRTVGDWADSDTSGIAAQWIPPVDVEEHENRFQLYVDLPGVAATDVEITLHAGVLTLTGERREPEHSDAVAHFRRERGHGRFHRRFILPDTVDSENVKATERHGVLEITIPKQAAAQPRRIEIAA